VRAQQQRGVELERDLARARTETLRAATLEAELGALKQSHATLAARCDSFRAAAGDAGDALANAEARADALSQARCRDCCRRYSFRTINGDDGACAGAGRSASAAGERRIDARRAAGEL
jgi:hypothetical protein